MGGWCRFVVEEVRPENEIIRAFVLHPENGEPTRRNYSIPSAPNGRIHRISVKREPHKLVPWERPAGTVLLVAPPGGDVFLPDRPVRPLVLLSDGGSLTPMMAMLETIAEHVPTTRPATSMRRVTAPPTPRAPSSAISPSAFPAKGPRRSTRHLEQKIVSAATMTGREGSTSLGAKRRQELPEADYYLCGSRPFLRDRISGLSASGVTVDRVHYEFFHPVDEFSMLNAESKAAGEFSAMLSAESLAGVSSSRSALN